MRFLCTTIILGTICLTAHAAHATGNVLVPSSGGSSTTLPNLGLVPQTAPTAADPTAPQPTNQAPATPQATTSQQPPALLVKPPASVPPPPTIPGTHVFQLPAIAPDARVTSLQAYTIAINGPETYVWAPQDVSKISQRLGLTPKKISQDCALSYGGSVLTNKGIYLFNSGFSPHTEAGYDGAIKFISVRIQALCSVDTLAPNLGYVVQMGDKYAVPLQSVHCPQPASNQSMRQVTISYAGKASTCRYQ